jgi:hypothetical protein
MNEQLIGDLFAEATRRMTSSSSKEFAEKFAELIVRECAEIADKAEPYKANDLIKQHFGVEDV